MNVASHLDGRFGGISAILPSLCEAVTKQGSHTISLAGFCQPDEQPLPVQQNVSVSCYAHSRRAWSVLASAPDRQRARRFAAEVASSDGIHIHGIWEAHCSVTASLARKHRRPYILAAHGMLDAWAINAKAFKKRIYSLLIENRNIRGAACLHALTQAEAVDYRRSGYRGPIAVIPNGVELAAGGNPQRFLAAHPQLGGKRLALFLARLHPKKGADILCRAWKQISAGWPDTHLLLAGPDFEGTEAALRSLVKELGLEKRVSFLGMLRGHNKWDALAAASVFVLPSHSEGFSVSVLEALGSGIPVIVTENCNVPEVEQSRCGWTVRPNVLEVQRALEDWSCSSPEILAQLGENGRTLVRERFGWQRVGANLADLYRWVNGQGSRPLFVEDGPGGRT